MKTKMIGLFAETSIHAGAGSSTGIIDLPIMRESHTNYPCIFGSAFKGALRSKAEESWTQADQKDQIQNIFGSEASESDAWAGAIMVSDARLLWLPVRSLNGHFKLVTCPYILQRWQRDSQRLGKNTPALPSEVTNMAIDENQTCYIPQESKKCIYLEEFQYSPKTLSQSDELLQALQTFVPEGYNIADKLCIVSDEQFAHLATIATAVTPHIAIEDEKKTVKKGALWYEETLPADTLFYSIVGTEAVRKPSANQTAEEVWDAIQQIFKDAPYLQIGGGETVGMGWVQLTAIHTEEAQA